MPRINRKPAQRTVARARPSSRLPMATAPTGPAPPKRKSSKDRGKPRTAPTDVVRAPCPPESAAALPTGERVRARSLPQW